MADATGSSSRVAYTNQFNLKLKLMKKVGQFTYTPTFSLTFRLLQTAYVDIVVVCNYFH
jgi:hypothetical protein